ncbi:hypothetical protein MTO96_051836 [Rhipicephalus appendiculatus]|uniref:Pancreatic trypsin inhibitor n=1 Tax=Rhipicephalus appendiculatus TaxID=34631 RepID=A0A131YWJ5_RHIAP
MLSSYSSNRYPEVAYWRKMHRFFMTLVVCLIGVYAEVVDVELLQARAAPQERSTLHENCTFPFDDGPCRARIPSFYYDKLSNSCHLFFYGGCGGNGNNFESPEQCEETCMGISSNKSSTDTLNWDWE